MNLWPLIAVTFVGSGVWFYLAFYDSEHGTGSHEYAVRQGILFGTAGVMLLLFQLFTP